jgi:hypothetical protein
MFAFNHDEDIIPDRTWDTALISATEHMANHITDIYSILTNPVHNTTLLEHYPHVCLPESLWRIIVASGLRGHYEKDKDTLESVRFTYMDLLKLEFNDSISHVTEYIQLNKSLINSLFFTLDDIQLLVHKSGIRNINLCGILDGHDILQHPNWVTKDGYTIPKDYGATVFWRLHPYSEYPVVPQLSDFNIDVRDIHVMFLPKRLDWINILVYRKAYDSPELTVALEEYRSVINNAIKNKSFPDFEAEHKKLLRRGLKVWVCDYESFYDVIDQLVTIDIKVDVVENELIDSYLSGYSDPNVEELEENVIVIENNYINDFHGNEYFKEYIETVASVFPEYAKFLESNEFLEAFETRYSEKFVNRFINERGGMVFRSEL